MNAVADHLCTEYGIMICDPPYRKTDHTIIKASLFNEGMKENASIFSHTQGWAVIAEAMLGGGNQAFRYYRAFMPAAYNTAPKFARLSRMSIASLPTVNTVRVSAPPDCRG